MKQAKWLKAIALWQMAGGVIGVAAFLDSLRGQNLSSDARLTALMLIVPLCLLSILAGWALFKGSRAARGPSLVLQALQLLGAGTSNLAFRVVFGPYVFFYVTNTMVGFNGGFVPQFYLHTRGPVPLPPHFVLNLLALASMIVLIRWRAATPVEPARAVTTPPISTDSSP